jgi:formate hydrogenlyase subunit 3/multisubunit Na+/H+ antiporter MnhD subunit
MIVFYSIGGLFISLIVLAIWYDPLVGVLSNLRNRISSSKTIKFIKRPLIGGFFVLIGIWILFQDWGKVPFAQGLQSNERWGYPVSRSVFVLVGSFLFVYFIRKVIKAFHSVYGKSDRKHP